MLFLINTSSSNITSLQAFTFYVFQDFNALSQSGLSSAAREEVKRRATVLLLSSFPPPLLFQPPPSSAVPPHPLNPNLSPGWYCCRFPLICPLPAVFLCHPSPPPCCAARWTEPRSPPRGWEGWWGGTLNLLMQSFVAIVSELAAPLPGSADRYSKTPSTAPSYWISITACTLYVCVCTNLLVCKSRCAAWYMWQICSQRYLCSTFAWAAETHT